MLQLTQDQLDAIVAAHPAYFQQYLQAHLPAPVSFERMQLLVLRDLADRAHFGDDLSELDVAACMERLVTLMESDSDHDTWNPERDFRVRGTIRVLFEGVVRARSQAEADELVQDDRPDVSDLTYDGCLTSVRVQHAELHDLTILN